MPPPSPVSFVPACKKSYHPSSHDDTKGDDVEDDEDDEDDVAEDVEENDEKEGLSMYNLLICLSGTLQQSPPCFGNNNTFMSFKAASHCSTWAGYQTWSLKDFRTNTMLPPSPVFFLPVCKKS